jgi:drug/metabolite transporter (DMT)-like permease
VNSVASSAAQRGAHLQAVGWFVLATFLWALAGPVTRFLSGASGFEVTFWRSLFAALTVLAYTLVWTHGQPARTGVLTQLREAGIYGLISAVMWSVMFCCFMFALTMTSAANVLLTQSLGPILTALLSSLVFRKQLGTRTWLVVLITCTAIAAMYIKDVSALGGKHTTGVLIALGVPCAAAINWVVQQKAAHNHKGKLNLTSGVMLGACISALAMLPFSLPFKATAQDIALLGFLGVFQLGIPCIIVVRLMDRVAAHEASLLGLLEIIFGIALTWIFAGEQPGLTTMVCGLIVVAALVYDENAKARSF